MQDVLTDVTAVEAEWLPGWRVIAVSYRGVLTQQQAEWRRVERAHRSRIGRPMVRKRGSGWALTLWMVDDRSLVGHTLLVSRAGQVSEHVRTLEPVLPMPQSF